MVSLGTRGCGEGVVVFADVVVFAVVDVLEDSSCSFSLDNSFSYISFCADRAPTCKRRVSS